MMVDESHISIPQIGGMSEGNKSRKQNLIDYGFRLPSAHDNRPLRFAEFEDRIKQAIYVSATPGKYEYANTDKKNIAQQIIRPTGLLDPVVTVKPTDGQIDDIIHELNATIKKGERALITTLTKKSAEKLTDHLREMGYNVEYLHSDIDTMERIEILRKLRLGTIDIIVGINLLREGLDLPEVSYIGIIDADKQGFLRSRDALIQIIGRAARNVDGHVTLYAREVSAAMEEAMEETSRRREIQMEYNKKHGITPEGIKKAVADISIGKGNMEVRQPKRKQQKIPKDDLKRLITSLEGKMELASTNMEFEKAADLRDEIELLKKDL
jgi:excinuclease ABC subunit B